MALKGVWRRTTLLDRLVVLGVALASLTSLALFARGAAGRRVIVLQEGRAVFAAPLDIDRTVRLPGAVGESVLVIREGKVCVVESPCPHKICIGSGSISQAGELVACVPNRLLIRIEGDPPQEELEYDLLSR